MKKTYTVTFFTCAVVIAVVLAAVLSFHKSESKTLKVGFIYVGDATTVPNESKNNGSCKFCAKILPA